MSAEIRFGFFTFQESEMITENETTGDSSKIISQKNILIHKHLYQTSTDETRIGKMNSIILLRAYK